MEDPIRPRRSARPRVMVTFQEGGENGGPFTSHRRIMESDLRLRYEFMPLLFPKGRIGVFNPRLIRTLVRGIREAEPDLVYAHGLQLAGFQALLAARLAKRPCVVAIRGSTAEALRFAGWKRTIVLALERWTLRHADACYGVSDYVSTWKQVRRHARNYRGTIRNLLPPEPPAPLPAETVRDEVRREFGLPPDAIVVLSTGRITIDKGFDLLTA